MRCLICLLFLAFTMTKSFAMSDYSETEFNNSVAKNEKFILFFHADWCPTCKSQDAIIKGLESDHAFSDVKIYKVDFDKEETLKKKLKVFNQSTLVGFFGRFELNRMTGVVDSIKIKEFIGNVDRLKLSDYLNLMKKESANKMPPEVKTKMENALNELKKSEIEKKVIKVGSNFPAFSLKDSDGKSVTLKSLLKNGPVVITFYRGSWCPYCNAQLMDFEKNITKFQAKKIQLVGVTPEKIELNKDFKTKKSFEFTILNDLDNKFATKLGLVFGVNKEIQEIYKKFGIDLKTSQGNDDWKLPIPATFVISQKGKVIYSFVDADYTKRASSEDVLNQFN